MKEKDFGIESSKSKETLRGLKKLAAVGSIAAAAFSLSACEGTANAEQSGGQSGGTVASEGSTVCNTETGAVVAKKDGMDPSVFKEPSVCETITPAPVSTETATPEPSETKTLETDSDWVDKEFLQKISIDYDSFDGWDNKDILDKLSICSALFRNNGLDTLTVEDQSLNPTLNSMSGQEIVDYWNKQDAIVWSVVNDRSDERNSDIAKKLTECITSDDLDANTDYGVRGRAEDSIESSIENSADPAAPGYIFEKVTKQSDRVFTVTSPIAKVGSEWDAYVVEASVTQPGPFGETHDNVQAVFKLQRFGGSSPLWQLVAKKSIESDPSDIADGMTLNLHDIE